MDWTHTTNMTKFTREMYAIIKFSDLLILSARKSLDLSVIPKIIRSRLYRNLSSFTGLRNLSLGSGSGGWVTEAYSESFLLGIPHMNHLVSFTLKYDCTVNILQVLAESCAQTLKILDMERSRQVRDDSIPYIIQFQKLKVLNIFQADFSLAGIAQILSSLTDIEILERGDFLCDVVEDMSEHGVVKQFRVKNFWASEEYFFHTTKQMALTAKYCPHITEMMFMFDVSHCDMLVLKNFQNLTSLELWGGRFYEDGTVDVLEHLGAKLKKLSLIHAEDIDAKAIALLTVFCPGLHSLGFHNCEFTLEDSQNRENDYFQVVDRHAFQEQEKVLKELMMPWLSVTRLKIVSSCPRKLLSMIIRLCLNVRELYFGMNSSISDGVISDALANNSLQNLELMSVQKCDKITMTGVYMLMDHCQNLRTITDLSNFEGISHEELEHLRMRIRDDNLDMSTGSECNLDAKMLEGNFMRRVLQSQFPTTA